MYPDPAVNRQLSRLVADGYIEAWAWNPDEDQKYHVKTRGGGLLRMTVLSTKVFCERLSHPSSGPSRSARDVADQRWGMTVVKTSASYL